MGAGGTVGIVGGFALALLAFIRIFLMRQITDLRDDVRRLESHVETLEKQYDEERGAKHKARNAGATVVDVATRRSSGRTRRPTSGAARSSGVSGLSTSAIRIRGR